MKVRAASSLFIVLSVLAFTAFAEDAKHAHQKEATKHAGLERFKQLTGDWVGKEVAGLEKGQEVRVKYKVTSAGSTVVETLFPDSDHEMLTLIHQDGDDLALTHYCALGNQPHMKTKGKSDGDKVAFKFSGASNLKSDKDMHMHEVTYTFVDKDTLKAEWTHYNDGKPAGTVVFELKRTK
ncbi:MAG: hypothetical protein E6K70_16845 [Planctomycetota bacterium]|nr:MAG: hypothetical protein E6K70_16845 [Planctomycetota bacterium]